MFLSACFAFFLTLFLKISGKNNPQVRINNKKGSARSWASSFDRLRSDFSAFWFLMFFTPSIMNRFFVCTCSCLFLILQDLRQHIEGKPWAGIENGRNQGSAPGPVRSARLLPVQRLWLLCCYQHSQVVAACTQPAKSKALTHRSFKKQMHGINEGRDQGNGRWKIRLSKGRPTRRVGTRGI